MNYVVGICFTELPKCFPRWVYHFHSHKHCLRVPVEPHPQEHLDVIALNFSLSSGCIWYFTMVLTWISLLTNDYEDLFMCLLVSRLYYFLYSKLAIFKTSVHLKNWIVLLLNWKSSLYSRYMSFIRYVI